MKLGIFGGTFNPPHIGHLIVIEGVRDQLKFDKILFVPSGNPPHKHGQSLAPANARLQMTSLAIRANDSFGVCDIELKRSGMSYSIDTLAQLSELYPKAELSLIIGVDNLLEFETWKSPQGIVSLADLVVMSRPGFSVHDLKNEYTRSANFINVPSIGISGTDIRRRVKLGRSIRYLVTHEVEDFIRRTGLYKNN
jgi:nicotinate-nucleotide adenylyltransferase